MQALQAPITLGLIGYGEVGKTFATGLKNAAGVQAVSAWDLKFAQPQAREGELAHAAGHGIAAQPGMAQLCQASRLDHLRRHRLQHAGRWPKRRRATCCRARCCWTWNSASPGTKQRAAEYRGRGRPLRGSGRDDLGAALRHPRAHAAWRRPRRAAGRAAARLGRMDATLVSERIGVASAIKMCRSVMIKAWRRW